MAKRRAVKAGALLEAVADYGHAYVRRSARLVRTRIGAADGIELAEIADIARPDQRGAMVRVARRMDPLLGILNIRRSDGPDRERYLAAEQFRSDTSIADGSPVRLTNLEGIGRRSLAFPGDGPAERIVRAQLRMRQAWMAVRGLPRENNAERASVVRLVLLGQATLEATDRALGWRCHGRKGRKLLFEGLDALVDFYRI